jgi:hypothetical protein
MILVWSTCLFCSFRKAMIGIEALFSKAVSPYCGWIRPRGAGEVRGWETCSKTADPTNSGSEAWQSTLAPSTAKNT